MLPRTDSEISKIKSESYEHTEFILHDQLNVSIWPEWVTDEKLLLIFIESRKKGEELPHNKMKATFVLECHKKGFPVLYHSTKDHFDDGLKELLQDFSGELTYMMPSEWDSRPSLRGLDEFGS